MIAYIAVKGNSIRCPRKNHVLLPYVLNNIKDIFEQIVVITDDNELADIAITNNVAVYWDKSKHKISEFHAIYDFLYETNKLYTNDEFIILPVTQPFRTKETIKEVIIKDMTDYDVVTTYTTINNRNIFLLNDKLDGFKIQSYNRKGSMCSVENMADGSIYKMRNSFLSHIVESENVNHEFWNSRIAFIRNTHPIFLDVDEPKDLELFNKLANCVNLND